MRGILAYGAYIPHYRLDRATIGAALGTPAGRGGRAVAGYDEDATTMGVEAARRAVAGLASNAVDVIYLATTSPPYLDKTNAVAVHAALALGSGAGAYDMVGSVRSGVAALDSALDSTRTALVVLSDIRTGLPGSAEERDGGDGAAAFVCGAAAVAPILAEYLGGASSTGEFLDRWRTPGDVAPRVWEERFGELAYASLADQAVADALKATGAVPDMIDHLIVAGPHPRAVKRVTAAVGARPEARVDDLSSQVGNTGTAHPGLLLASVLDRAEPDALIALIVLADGVDVRLFRTTEALATAHRRPSLAAPTPDGRCTLSYQTYLTWRGLLVREPPRRPEPEIAAAPPSFRAQAWKFSFTAGRCLDCGARHLPPARICRSCDSLDRMAPEPMADVPATVTTFTVDHLAHSLNPPMVCAVVDFDGGGRLQCELTETDAESLRIGDGVEMTFRRLSTTEGVHNYFWKARPRRAPT